MHIDGECPVDDEEPHTSNHACVGPIPSTTKDSQESCQRESFSSLANRVRAPPPLSRVYSPMNGPCSSPPETLSTSASSEGQTCQFDLASMPSVNSDLPSSLACGSDRFLNAPRHRESACTSHVSSAAPDKSAVHDVFPADSLHCDNHKFSQVFHPKLPSTPAGAGATLSGVVPLYVFGYTPVVTFAAVAHAGLQPHQVLAHDP